MGFRRKKGVLYVISAPSGAGKSTLCNMLMESVGNIGFSVSHTTRPPRGGEVDGRDYYFTSPEDFARMVSEDGFVEWAEVHGNRYGTSKAELDRLTGEGRDVILDIDTQGADQLRSSGVDATYVFVLPPDMPTLEERLRGRGTDSDEVIKKRMVNAVGEIRRYADYEYIIVNDDLGRALEELKAVVTAAKQKTANMDAGAVKKAFGLTE